MRVVSRLSSKLLAAGSWVIRFASIVLPAPGGPMRSMLRTVHNRRECLYFQRADGDWRSHPLLVEQRELESNSRSNFDSTAMSASQAGRRGFDPRLPLLEISSNRGRRVELSR